MCFSYIYVKNGFDTIPSLLSHCYQTAVHKSFAVSDNLGEVSAKAQIQTVCFDNLGLLLAALLNIMLRNNQRFKLSFLLLLLDYICA